MPVMQASRDLVATVVTLARLIRTEADKRARAHGMTRAQWSILLHLEQQPGLLQKELADILEVEPITVARLVDRLEARGMVERRGDPADRRCWRLHLTEAARPLMGEVNVQLDALSEATCANLDAETQAKVVHALKQMRDTVYQHARDKADAMEREPASA